MLLPFLHSYCALSAKIVVELSFVAHYLTLIFVFSFVVHFYLKSLIFLM